MKISERWTDRIIGICISVATLAAVIMTASAGMPQKWHAAILGALVPFAAVVSIKRSSWLRSTFWTTLAACFVVNLLLLWVFFEIILRNVTTFGWIWWVPVAFVESVVLLHFQPKLERKLRAQ
jgi:uncharacterized membrane protein YccC